MRYGHHLPYAHIRAHRSYRLRDYKSTFSSFFFYLDKHFSDEVQRAKSEYVFDVTFLDLPSKNVFHLCRNQEYEDENLNCTFPVTGLFGMAC